MLAIGRGSKIGHNCQRIEVKKCQSRWGCQKTRKNADVVYGQSLTLQFNLNGAAHLNFSSKETSKWFFQKTFLLHSTVMWSLYKYYGGASTFFISLMAVANFCHTATAALALAPPKSPARAVSLPLVILLTNKNVTTNCRRLKQRQPAAAALCAARRAALRETAVYKILMIHFNHKNRCFKVPPNDLSSQNDGLGHVK